MDKNRIPARDSESELAPPFVSSVVGSDVLTAARGGGILFAGSVIGNALRLPLGILLARLLGPKQLGLYNLAVSTVFILSGLTVLGMTQALVRYISLYRSRGDSGGLWHTLQPGIGLPTVFGLGAGAGVFFLSVPISEHLFHAPKLVPLLKMTALVIPSWTFVSVASAAVRGFKRMEYDAVANGVTQPLVRLVLVIVFSQTIGLTAETALVSFGLSVMVSAMILLFWLHRLLPSERAPIRSDRYQLREMLVYALPLYVSDFLDTIAPYLNLFMLGALSTPSHVGVFSPIIEVIRVAELFYLSLAMASAPVLVGLHDRGTMDQMKAFYQMVSKWSFIVSLPIFLAIFLFPAMILSVFGEHFIAGAAALRILALSGLVNTSIGITYMVIIMTGHTKLKLVNALIRYTVMLGLNLILIPMWGPTGAAVATLAAVVFVSILRVTEVFILFRMAPINRAFLSPLAAGFAALVIASGLYRLLPLEQDWVRTGIAWASLFMVYTAIIVATGLSKEDYTLMRQVYRYISPRKKIRKDMETRNE